MIAKLIIAKYCEKKKKNFFVDCVQIKAESMNDMSSSDCTSVLLVKCNWLVQLFVIKKPRYIIVIITHNSYSYCPIVYFSANIKKIYLNFSPCYSTRQSSKCYVFFSVMRNMTWITSSVVIFYDIYIFFLVVCNMEYMSLSFSFLRGSFFVCLFKWMLNTRLAQKLPSKDTVTKGFCLIVQRQWRSLYKLI